MRKLFVQTYFGEYLDRAAGLLDKTVPQLMTSLALHYDGFCFDEKASTHVYSPWSVLSFLSDPTDPLKHYWFDSAGTPAFLMNYLKTHQLLDPSAFDNIVPISLTKLAAVDRASELDSHALLAHSGYLTIKSVRDGMAFLGYPNIEVKEALGSLFSSVYWPNDETKFALASDFQHALKASDMVLLKRVLNQIVHQLDYQNFTLQSEAAVRQLVQVFCIGACIENRIEVHSLFGRSDLEISLPDRNVVFEFKFAKQAGSAAALLAEARTQISDRDYGTPARNGELLRIAAVFSGEARKFVEVEAV